MKTTQHWREGRGELYSREDSRCRKAGKTELERGPRPMGWVQIPCSFARSATAGSSPADAVAPGHSLCHLQSRFCGWLPAGFNYQELQLSVRLKGVEQISEVMSDKIQNKRCVPITQRRLFHFSLNVLHVSSFSEAFLYISSLSSCVPASFDFRFGTRSPWDLEVLRNITLDIHQWRHPSRTQI